MGMGSEICPTKDLIQALMETLVDPSLPSRVDDKPPVLSVQEVVAKQMHAVVLLYNYYHRKQQPKAEFLEFVAFSKLSVRLRETMIPFMKFTNGNEPVELNDLNKLSVTEKAIRDACNISMALDDSKDVPAMEGWPIAKVAVFLTDSKNENCLLQFGGVTQGVWSLIEKHLDEYSISSQNSSNKRKRNGLVSTSKNDADVDGILLLAFTAVKEVTGLKSSDLVILGTYTVHSLSREKTTTRFYMMRCDQINKGKGTPIEEMLKCLQGPLVENSGGSWIVAPAVEYYLLEPYAGIISHWFSGKRKSSGGNSPSTEIVTEGRRLISPALDNIDKMQSRSKLANDKQYKLSSTQKEPSLVKISQAADDSLESHSKLANDKKDKLSSTQKEATPVKISQATDKSRESHSKLADDRKHKHSSTQKDASAVKSKEGHVDLDASNKAYNIDAVLNQSVGKEWAEPQITFSSETCSSAEDARENQIFKVEVHQNKKNPSSEQLDACAPVGEDEAEMEDSSKLNGTRERDDKVSGETCHATTSHNRDEIPLVNAESIELQNDPAIEALQNTLTILHRKQQEMYSEICCREVQFALLQENIRKVSDALECMKSMSAPYSVSSKGDFQQRSLVKLTGSPGTSSFQDLQSMCLKNNWRLPRYFFEPSYGKFVAKAMMTEKDELFIATSDLKTNPQEAIDSAAAQLVAKLQNSLSAND